LAPPYRRRTAISQPHRVAAVRSRLADSWVGDCTERLKAADFFNATMLIGATTLLSVLPFLIVVSSLAHQRIDDDLSRHIGLDSEGARIVRGLFPTAPDHDTGSIVTALVVGLAGTLVTVNLVQGLYERIFRVEHRGWRDVGRYLVWVGGLLGALVVAGLTYGAVRDVGGLVLLGPWRVVVATAFFWWGMHFLLAGRVGWRTLLRPAFVTAVFWVGLAVFSWAVFSSTIVSDSRLYGTIGVVFTLLTWFIAIGAVVVLGAAVGATWDERRGRRTGAAE